MGLAQKQGSSEDMMEHAKIQGWHCVPGAEVLGTGPSSCFSHMKAHHSYGNCDWNWSLLAYHMPGELLLYSDSQELETLLSLHCVNAKLHLQQQGSGNWVRKTEALSLSGSSSGWEHGPEAAQWATLAAYRNLMCWAGNKEGWRTCGPDIVSFSFPTKSQQISWRDVISFTFGDHFQRLQVNVFYKCFPQLLWGVGQYTFITEVNPSVFCLYKHILVLVTHMINKHFVIMATKTTCTIENTNCFNQYYIFNIIIHRFYWEKHSLNSWTNSYGAFTGLD